MSVTSDSNPAIFDRGLANFRRLMRIVAIVYVIGLIVIFSYKYYSYASKVDAITSQIFFVALQARSALNYYLLWIAVGLVAFGATFLKKKPFISFYILLGILAETIAYVAYFLAHHHSYQPVPPIWFERFDAHPLLVVELHEGSLGYGVSQDSNHHRTTINEGKVARPKFIFVFGGSTAYDPGNTDKNTWPSRLSALLGKNFAVENFGIPAYSSLENLIQSLFAFRDQPPSCAIYYEGWNDLRNSHAKNLRNDYSDMELPHIANILQPGRHEGFLETYSVLIGYVGSIFRPMALEDSSGEVSDNQDLRLSKIYQDNIKLIADIGRHFGVKVIFIPQILNYARLTGDNVGGLPYIRRKDTKKLMALMNEDLARAAGDSQAHFIDAPLSVGWTNGDFADEGHFNAPGAQKFAQSIVEDVRKICQ